jgi:zinc protease
VWWGKFLSLCFALYATAASAAPKSDIETFNLSNGLEVIVIENHRIPAVSHMIWYRVGAADDPTGKSGLAHFHEHLMFQGTEKTKPGEFADIINKHGGEQNAFTTRDTTSYYVTIEKKNLPLVMDLESDRMRGLKVADDNALRERQVIIEERRMRIENNPDAQLSEQINAALYRNHPYHVPIIGWMSEMEGLSLADVVNFHKTWYHPNNAVLILSGDITAAEAKPLVEKYYGGLSKQAVPQRIWNVEPPHIASRRVTLHHSQVNQPIVSREYMSSSFKYGDTKDALPLFVLSQLLGGGKNGLLYKTLVVDQKVATSVSADYDGFSIGPGQFSLTIVPEAGITSEKAEAALDKELQTLLSSRFSQSDVTRAKTLLKAESIFAREGLSSMARIMGTLRMLDLPADYFSHWPELIDAVTTEQLEAAMKKTLILNASVTGELLPEEKAP